MRKPMALVTLLSAGLGLQQAPPLRASETRLSAEGFVALMERLADAWSRQDTERGVGCFTDEAVYMQPPDGSSSVAAPSCASTSAL